MIFLFHMFHTLNDIWVIQPSFVTYGVEPSLYLYGTKSCFMAINNLLFMNFEQEWFIEAILLH